MSGILLPSLSGSSQRESRMLPRMSVTLMQFIVTRNAKTRKKHMETIKLFIYYIKELHILSYDGRVPAIIDRKIKNIGNIGNVI